MKLGNLSKIKVENKARSDTYFLMNYVNLTKVFLSKQHRRKALKMITLNNTAIFYNSWRIVGTCMLRIVHQKMAESLLNGFRL